MSNGFKIAGVLLFIWTSFSASSQIEKGLIPFSNKLLLNPSYAGFGKNTHFWNSLQFNAQPEKNFNHTYSFTYDAWSEKMQGGWAVQFYQGLTGALNTNTTGAGFSFSRPYDAGRTGQLIPSVNLNLYAATKQWFVHFIDRTIDKNFDYQSPPGEDFFRYSVTRPAVGLLWNSPSLEMGLTALYSFYHDSGEEKDTFEPLPLFLVFHASKKKRGKHRGLVSLPVKISPELTILYSENFILSRAGFRMERTDLQLGFFAQNNFTANTHGIGGAFGWKFNNLRLMASAGGTYSFPKKKPGFFGEISLGLVIPYVHFNENFPWAPPPPSF